MSFLHCAHHVPGASPSKGREQTPVPGYTHKKATQTDWGSVFSCPTTSISGGPFLTVPLLFIFQPRAYEKNSLHAFSIPQTSPQLKMGRINKSNAKKKENNGSRDMISHKACLAFFLFAIHIRC